MVAYKLYTHRKFPSDEDRMAWTKQHSPGHGTLQCVHAEHLMDTILELPSTQQVLPPPRRVRRLVLPKTKCVRIKLQNMLKAQWKYSVSVTLIVSEKSFQGFEPCPCQKCYRIKSRMQCLFCIAIQLGLERVLQTAAEHIPFSVGEQMWEYYQTSISIFPYKCMSIFVTCQRRTTEGFFTSCRAR